MAKVIAIANQKGGVGKTTTCVNLSSCVAALGKKVLVVDLDPQGNTTSGYGVAKKGQQSNIYTCLINDDDIRQAIVHTKFNADLIASNTQLAGAVVELVELPRRENRLRSILAPLIPLYDYVFIDCPPSLDLLTVNGLCACDTVLIPIQCEYYALEGLSELMNTLKIVRKKYNHYLDIEGRGVHHVLRPVQLNHAGGCTGQKVLWQQGLQNRCAAHRAPFGSAQFWYAHQFLRAERQGQRSLYGHGA